MSDPAIDVVFFDIGNVLLKFDAASVLREVACSIGRHPLTVAKYLWHSRIGEDIELGKVTGRDLHELFRRELDYPGDFEAFRRLWCDHFRLHRGTAGLLKRLTRTHRVFLLSNTNALHYDFIRERYAFTGQVHGAVLSYELGLRKPDPRIYRAALERAATQAGRAVFIDDLPENVTAAKRIGIHAIRFTGMDPLEKELRSLGVLNGRGAIAPRHADAE